VPYQELLDEIVGSVPGVHGALLLDSEGELVLESGARDFRHRLIGAYQGIALTIAHRVCDRYDVGRIRSLVCRYDWGTVILRPLKDGYYLLVSVGTDGHVAQAARLSTVTQERMNEEL
jgi:predicted regulator of Ras-like GTPase activity (Roadblock/LC7/MglB family)